MFHVCLLLWSWVASQKLCTPCLTSPQCEVFTTFPSFTDSCWKKVSMYCKRFSKCMDISSLCFLKVLLILVWESLLFILTSFLRNTSTKMILILYHSKDPIQICSLTFPQRSASIMWYNCQCTIFSSHYLHRRLAYVCSDPLGPVRPGSHANHQPLKEAL